MIKEFKNNPIRPTGVINRGMFEQVKMLYLQNPTAGGELAVSLMEHVLTGDHSSDDFMVSFAIANHKEVISKNQVKYDAKQETKHSAKADELRPVVELHCKGLTQAAIAKELKMAQSTVSKRLAAARAEFPELFEEYSRNNLEYSDIPKDKNIPEYSNIENNSEYRNNIPNGLTGSEEVNLEYIPENRNNENIPIFQIFQHVNVNDNVNGNDSISPAGESGLRPDTPTASPTYKEFREMF
jgi:transcriptional regulator with XRE-family HTH domain